MPKLVNDALETMRAELDAMRRQRDESDASVRELRAELAARLLETTQVSENTKRAGPEGPAPFMLAAQ